MWMRPNGVETEELCPNCDYPYPVTVRHGNDDHGPVHDWSCPKCGGGMSIVGYHCAECAMEPANNELGGLAQEEVMVKSFFEISEMTKLGKQVYEIVEDGNPQGKYIIVSVEEWEAYEAAQQGVQRTGFWTCENCGASSSTEIDFCSSCGDARR